MTKLDLNQLSPTQLVDVIAEAVIEAEASARPFLLRQDDDAADIKESSDNKRGSNRHQLEIFLDIKDLGSRYYAAYTAAIETAISLLGPKAEEHIRVLKALQKGMDVGMDILGTQNLALMLVRWREEKR